MRVRLIPEPTLPRCPGRTRAKGTSSTPRSTSGAFPRSGTAWRNGRDLKKKRKALDEYKKTLDTLRKAYEDRVNIARNYDAMITDQEHIIAATNTEIQRATRAREDVERKIADANEELAELKRRPGQGAQAPRGGARLPKRGARLRQG